MTISPAAPLSDPAAGMVDADTFRQALARHAAGVVIVTFTRPQTGGHDDQ